MNLQFIHVYSKFLQDFYKQCSLQAHNTIVTKYGAIDARRFYSISPMEKLEGWGGGKGGGGAGKACSFLVLLSLHPLTSLPIF